jgi:DNA-binding response OmpR family regulator
MANILIVEDDEALREVLAEFLLEEGHTITIACTGQEALNLFRQAEERLVLLDMMLPGVSGLEIIRWLEDHPKQASGTQVIAMSAGWTRSQKATRPVSPVVKGTLPKPFDLEDLVALIHTISSSMQKC